MIREPSGELSAKERVLSTGAGLLLAAAAARPRPNAALSLLALAAGTALAWRGTTGYCPARAALAGNPRRPLARQ